MVKVLYVADNGENTCQECLDNDGKIFDIDDPELPLLPVHPHCRCKYVSVADPYEDVSEDVERHRIVENLEAAGDLDEEKAKTLAEQIIAARRENSKLREQKLFLLFNGRYLMSSDGKLLLDAVSGQAVSENATVKLLLGEWFTEQLSGNSIIHIPGRELKMKAGYLGDYIISRQKKNAPPKPARGHMGQERVRGVIIHGHCIRMKIPTYVKERVFSFMAVQSSIPRGALICNGATLNFKNTLFQRDYRPYTFM